MSLSALLARAHAHIQAHRARQPDNLPQGQPVVLFFSLSNGAERAVVRHYRAATFEAAWQQAVRGSQRLGGRSKASWQWLRVDWVTEVQPATWQQLRALLGRTKRNYFRCGLALDARFDHAFLEQELNANAMLYGGSAVECAQLNEKNFLAYARRRFGPSLQCDFADDAPVWRFATAGVFVAQPGSDMALPGQGEPQVLPAPPLAQPWNAPRTLDCGRRQVAALDAKASLQLVRSASAFLARQVGKQGRFVYGHFPCFGRTIASYNALRHASSLYAMLEGWELTREPALMAAIERGLAYLAEELIAEKVLPDGTQAAFLVDTGEEIKLGGNAVCLLALSKYTELTGNQRYLPLLERLALGVLHMQDDTTGQFVHVLHAHDLSVKEAFRIIYYDGEAAFGLMRLYGITRDVRWLAAVEKAFAHFLQAGHWKAHDHWLSYCANELTRYRPEERYFRFGVQNIRDHLDFILQRETTFPTLLELAMAFEQMLRRIEAMPQMHHLLEGFDKAKFYRALHHRAHYLLNGCFWPEFAMFFAKPQSVAGSFFIRHHAFRVRIDDVEHYLSGYVAYWKMLTRDAAPATAQTAVREQALAAAEATRGVEPADLAPEWVRPFRGLLFKHAAPDAIAVSVIIPLYNRAQAVRDCLKRLRASLFDRERMEVIVIDDASSDGSFEAAKAFVDDFPNILVARRAQNSGGASLPRNHGLDLASGRWVLFVDSDDYITAHALSDAMALAEAHPGTDLVCMPYFRAHGSRRAISASAFHYPKSVAGLRFEQTMLCNSLNAVGKLMRRSVLEEHAIRFPQDIRMREDNWFTMKLYAVARQIAILGNEKPYYFIADQDEVSLSSTAAAPEDVQTIFLSVHAFVLAQPTLEPARAADLLAIYMNRYAPLLRKSARLQELALALRGSLASIAASAHLSAEAQAFVRALMRQS
ncbi:glycosyltransferase family 2 protein [Lampropedia cohaerens]|uniref:glycosyltransferase family 2 protein n=1 Tax=Lampropedia cohaerens TaxID=1610491 RepID=UPI00069B6EE8|nr:glycosyltransferase family 2 protein [Lampropedia cohaerens]